MGERSRGPTQRLGGGREGRGQGEGAREGGNQSWLGAETRVFSRELE